MARLEQPTWAVPALLLAWASLGALDPQAARAQALGAAAGSQAETIALRLAQRDGRPAGLHDGQTLGRDQALVRAWLAGFDEGLHEGRTSWRVGNAHAEGERTGRAAGYPEGWDLGAQHGEGRAAAAYALLAGRPAFRPEGPPPGVASPPPPPPFSACEVPDGLKFPLSHGRSGWVRPATCERDPSPAPWAVPKPNLAAEDAIRDMGRHEGLSSGEALAEFLNAYRRYYRDHYEEAFEAARDAVSGFDLDRARADGQRSGGAEGARREACEAFAAGHARGWRTGRDDGFARGFEEGWRSAAATHDAQPVVIVEAAALVDATGDGVVEPGEAVSLSVTLANAGLVAAPPPLAGWQAERGMTGAGALEAGLAAQSRRTEVAALGPTDAGAPFGASIVVGVRPRDGRPRTASAAVGRPVVLESVAVSLDAREDVLVRRVTAGLRSVALTRVDRGARLRSGEVEAEVGPMESGVTRSVELVLPGPANVEADLEAVVELRDGAGAFWMQRGAASRIPMHRLVAVAGDVSDAEPLLRAARTRLLAEVDEAKDDRKLFREAGASSDLAEYGAALGRLPAAVRERFEREVSAPLLLSIEAKGTPRPVRRAVREALGVN